jgi:hypothetical protein
MLLIQCVQIDITNSMCTNLLAFIKHICHFLFVWRHGNGRRKRLASTFYEIVIGWFSSTIVSGSRALPPRWPPECCCVIIESSFDPGERLQADGSLYFIYSFFQENGSVRCRTQFWKGTTQGSFQQILVEMGLVVSEEKIFWVGPFQNCIRQPRPPKKKMAAVAKNLNFFNFPLLL